VTTYTAILLNDPVEKRCQYTGRIHKQYVERTTGCDSKNKKKKNHGMWGYFGDWLSAPDAVVQVLQHSPDSRSVLSKRQVNMAETSIKVTHEPVLDH
jgi:hypothetical protein